jgi:two-component sensor histidine kinase
MTEGLTFEITGSTKELREGLSCDEVLKGRITWERLDKDTWNLTLSYEPDFPGDDVIEEWAETHGLGCRLV